MYLMNWKSPLYHLHQHTSDANKCSDVPTYTAHNFYTYVWKRLVWAISTLILSNVWMNLIYHLLSTSNLLYLNFISLHKLYFYWFWTSYIFIFKWLLYHLSQFSSGANQCSDGPHKVHWQKHFNLLKFNFFPFLVKSYC